MSKKHYTNYQKMSENVEPVNETADVIETAVEETTEEVIEEQVEEVIPEEAKKVYGTVTDCIKLNVRSMPSTDGAVLCLIANSSEVEIIEDNPSSEYYKVCTETGVMGFCMKKYVTVKQ